MCGIAGFAAERDDHQVVTSLCSSLDRRGPDGTGWGTFAGQVLVQTRLAIIDLSDRVAYPLSNENGSVWLVFNGEIYDHAQLRQDLEARGHSFRTRCDAEVVVHAFEEWDLDAFPRLNGMFALAIVDGRDGRTILARDRFGIKPLVHTTMGRFAWGSDAMALVRAGLATGAVDRQAVADFAAFHYVPPPGTGIVGISQLRPGAILVRQADGTQQERQFVEPLPETEQMDADAARTRADEALAIAVNRQLVADVEVGVLLSSGVDSALLLAMAAEAGARPRAFTLAFAGTGDYDESSLAAATAEVYGVPHEIEQFDVGFADAMTQMGRVFDQPFADPSSIATIQLARMARRKVKVVLSGSGGDELFAGYYRLRAHRLRGLGAVAGTLDRVMAPTRRGAERSTTAGLLGSYGKRLLAADSSSSVAQYLSLIGSSTSESGLEAFRDRPDLAEARLRQELNPPPAQMAPTSTLRRLLAYETGSYLPGDILTKEDRATMSVGLEARVPILDEQVARTAASIPDRHHASLLRGKQVLRDVAEHRVEKVAMRRGKRGFALPLGHLLSGGWREEALEWFSGASSDLIDPGTVTGALRSGEHVPLDTWAAGCLAAWEGELALARRASPRATD